MHIARNAAGVVVFRARSENELKDMIDSSIHQKEQKVAEEAEKKAKTEERKLEKKKRGFFAPPVEEEVKTDEASVLIPTTPPQTRVTRGSDGKFISKSTLDTEEEKKKGFWQKLTS